MGVDAKGRLTGGSQSLTLDGQVIHITTATPSATKNMANPTDTSDYDPVTKMLMVPNIPISVETSFDCEGYYRLSETPANIISLIYSADPIPLVFKLDATHQLIAGDFHMTDYSSDHPTDDLVTFSCTLVPEGAVVIGNPTAGP